jgi:cytochrome P450
LRGQDKVAAFLTQGEEWRQLRSGLAADLMQPKAARTYLPMINRAVEQGCHGLEDYEGTLDKFVALLAFDMFAALSLGSIMDSTNSSNQKFVQDSQLAFDLLGQMFLLQPEERSTHPLWFKFVVAMDDAQARAHQLVTEVVEALESGTATGMQQQSYVAKLVDRGELSRDEIVHSVMLLLQAGVDTTASSTNMLLINLASNLRVQDKLRDELLSVCPSGDVTEEHLKQMPYLKACIRESQRLTPSLTAGTVRPAPRDMVMSGYEIPEGTLVMTNNHSIQNNPDLMDRVNEFLPERWSEQAVQARKGTEKEVCDHALLRDSFGMGARSCLGQRVAKLEIQVATARLIREHRLELPEGQNWQIRMSPFAKAEPFPNIKLSSVA